MRYKTFFCYCLLYLLLPFVALSAQQRFDSNLHAERLAYWKGKNFSPRVIYDIGAYHGYWSKEIQEVFPSAKFYLFEANPNNRPFLSRSSFPFFIALLGEKEGEATFYSNNSTGDSMFREQTKYYDPQSCTKYNLPVTTLSKVVKDNSLPLPDLVKFDVQGAEKMVINGGADVIKNAQLIILETKVLEYNKEAPLALEIMSLMDKLGYRLLDVLECHYLPTGELNEIDFLFVKKDSDLIKTGLLIQ